MNTFDADHAPGAMILSASRMGCLVLPPEHRPRWMPSPFAYALHLRGDVPLPDADNARTRRGRRMEPVGEICAREDHGLTVLDRQVRRECDMPAVTYLDLLTDRAPLELKTVDERDFVKFWDGRPPLHVRTQAQAQALIAGVDVILIGAIVIAWGDVRMELFEEPVHPGMAQLLSDRAGEFLDTLRRGDLPPMDESASSYAAWAEMAIFAKGERLRLLDPEAVTRAEEWRLAKEAGKISREADEMCKAYFAAIAGDAETIELLDGTLIERRRVERKGYEVKANSSIQWRLKRAE